MEALAAVAVVSTLGMTISFICLVRLIPFMVNTAVARNPVELAQRTKITTEDKKPTPKKEPRPRPEGI